MQEIKHSLKMYFMILHKSFHEDCMVLNPGKRHYTVIIDNDPSHKIILNNNGIASSNEKKTSRYYIRQQIEFRFSYYVSL